MKIPNFGQLCRTADFFGFEKKVQKTKKPTCTKRSNTENISQPCAILHLYLFTLQKI